ncbi:LysR family transcriptional regulator, partial [candidate division GN15 bacterium]|nr:LysR family transcriptional regulator [candidate division GN15 bacterium]
MALCMKSNAIFGKNRYNLCMDFRIGHLRHFIVLIEEGNFARAAERLCITQPTLSRSMQSLENKLEAQLLDRSGRTVTATPIGDALAGYAREILKQSEQAVNDIGLLAGRQIGHLRIGVGPYPASISVASAVARFVTSFPGISMNVDVADWNVM